MANVIEQFFIQFLTDALAEADRIVALEEAAKDAAKAEDEIGKSAAKANAEVEKGAPAARKVAEGLKEADKQATAANASMSKMGRTLAGWVAGFLSVRAVVGLVRGALDDINQLSENANRFNINPEGYNAFNQIIEDMGGNAEKAERGLRRFTDSISDGFGDAESAAGKALTSLGVHTADANGKLRDTEAIMMDVAGALEGMNQQAQLAKLRDLGVIDPAIRDLLLEGRQGLASRFAAERAKGLITNETVANVRKFKMAWDDAKDSIKGVVNAIIGGWAPAMTEFAGKLETFIRASTAWFQTHGELVKGFLIGLGAIVTFLTVVYIPAWWAAAAAVLAATWPLLLIIGLIAAVATAFALAWEDVQAFLHGQPSLLGELVKRYGWVREAVEWIGRALKALPEIAATAWQGLTAGARAVADFLGDAFRAVWSVVGPILGFIGNNLRLLWEIARLVAGGIAAAFGGVVKVLGYIFGPELAQWGAQLKAFGALAEMIGKAWGAVWSAVFDGIVGGIKNVINWIKTLSALLGGAADALHKVNERAAGPAARQTRENVTKGAADARAAGRAALASSTPHSVSNRQATNSTNVTVGKVEVKTQATDADGMAKAASGALKSELRRVTANASDGVAR